MAVTAIIVGGGSSSRMKGTDKLRLPVDGMTVFEKSIRAFCLHPETDHVIAVAREDLVPEIRQLQAKYPKLTAVVPGGASRCLSVRQGVEACPPGTEYVAIHDAARPFVSASLISSVLAAARESGAAIPGLPVTDTVKRVREGTVEATLDRSVMATVQTPQIFLYGRYREALADAEESFDDCQIYERTGNAVRVVPGEKTNIKITTPDDAASLDGRQNMASPDLRIGHGYDVHRLTEGRKLILGGVEIPFEKGLLGHSDADALLHALADALLGAAGLRDIGFYFPDTDPAFEGADSRELLRETVSMLAEKGYRPANADLTILCQRPKLAPHIEQMRRNIAADLGIEEDRIGLKATTEEKLGFTGEGLGIAAHAVVTIIK